MRMMRTVDKYDIKRQRVCIGKEAWDGGVVCTWVFYPGFESCFGDTDSGYCFEEVVNLKEIMIVS